jgi:hypothetical protein
VSYTKEDGWGIKANVSGVVQALGVRGGLNFERFTNVTIGQSQRGGASVNLGFNTGAGTLGVNYTGATGRFDGSFDVMERQAGTGNLSAELNYGEDGFSVSGNADLGNGLGFVDRKRVQFVMQMIIENAVIYSRQGSRVDVEVEQRKSFIYVSVRDTGIGIAPGDMEHLFSRFFRASNASETHTEGLGIGLFVSRDIMKRHGGDLWAESAGIGKGSTFHMKIPLEK